MLWGKIGHHYARKKKYSIAAKYLSRAKPSSLKLEQKISLAESLHYTGKSEEAASYLKEVIRDHPSIGWIHERRAHILREMYREEEAIEELDEAIRLDGDHYMNWYTRGLAHKDLGHYEEAIHDLKESIRREDASSVISTYYELAMVFYQSERYEEALPYFEKTLSSSKVIPNYYFMHAITLEELGRTPEAIDTLLKGKILLDKYRSRPDQGYAIFAETTLYSYGAFLTFQRLLEPTFAFRLTLFRLYAGAGDHDSAQAMIDEVILMFPGTAELFFQRGKWHSEQGKMEEAIRDFDECIRLEPAHVQAMLGKANTYRSRHLHTEAAGMLENIIAIDPDNVLARYWLADSLCVLEQYDQALAASEELLKLEDDDPLNYIQRGDICMGMNQPGEAELSFAQATRLEDSAKARGKRAYALYLLGRHEEALAQHQEEARLDPSLLDHPYYHAGIGHNYKALGDWEFAISEYSRAIELDAEQAEFYLCRAQCFLETEAWSRTEQDCTKGMTLQPELTDFYNMRGFAYYSLKEYERARQDVQACIALQPQVASGYYNLGRIEYAAGNPDEALAYLEQALQRNAMHALSYLYQAYIHYDNFNTDACVESIARWALYSDVHATPEAKRRAIETIDEFDEDVREQAAQHLGSFYGEAQYYS